jgi:hypothetical protein
MRPALLNRVRPARLASHLNKHSLCCPCRTRFRCAVRQFDSGDPGFGDAFVSDPRYPIQYGNDFTLASGADITGLSWYGAYKPLSTSAEPIGPDSFSIRIFGMTAGEPNAVPFASFSHVAANRDGTVWALPFPGEQI